MDVNDPLTPLAFLPGLADAAARAVAAITRAHRRPAGLRRPEVISSESLLRGARATSPDMRVIAGPEASAYSLLAPDLLSTTVRSFARAPLGVLARIDVAAGGEGVPVAGAASRSDVAASRLQGLARLITSGAGVEFDRLAPAVVYAEIAAYRLFGRRSEVVARVAARAMAVNTGLDPRCFAVPETYLRRHVGELSAALAGYALGEVRDLLVLVMDAWAAGGEEADAIARAV